MEDREINWDQDEPQESIEDRSVSESINDLIEQIDQNLVYIYDYLSRALSSGESNYNNINNKYNQIVSEYEIARNNAITIKDQNVDPTEIQNAVNNLQIILGYSEELARYIENGQENNQTEMITGGNEVITMEEVGPVRSWWAGLSDNTRLLLKAASIGLGIFVAKKLFDSAMKNIKLQKVSELREELEREIEDEEEEE